MRFPALAALAVVAAPLAPVPASAGFVAVLGVTEGAFTGTDRSDAGFGFIDLAGGLTVGTVNGYRLDHGALHLSATLDLPAVPVGRAIDISLLLRLSPTSPFDDPTGTDALFTARTVRLGRLGPGATGTVHAEVAFAGGSGVTESDLSLIALGGTTPTTHFTRRPGATDYYQVWHVHLEGGFKGGSVSAESVFAAPAPAPLVLLGSALPFAGLLLRRRALFS
ncbi:unnamed protein product [Gemmata massiliana]|uniref:PEP-CTERM protein-sorting domain-containing protein n=1 Tax=Gemmata massiliana TaxID=1210884 RepID=A0A6P2DBQ8_9BACT|nr:hypothetical protein [Gemmata massiliana]VTR97795.1 unnamed protein product [Gemmata massiliana]